MGSGVAAQLAPYAPIWLAAKGGGMVAELLSPLPPSYVRPADFDVWRELPTDGTLGQLLRLRVHVTNRASTLRQLRLSFAENDAFLFCGFKLYHFQLPPKHEKDVDFALLPIVSGSVQLPPVRLTCTTTNTELLDAQAVHRVFVQPAAPVFED